MNYKLTNSNITVRAILFNGKNHGEIREKLGVNIRYDQTGNECISITQGEARLHINDYVIVGDNNPEPRRLNKDLFKLVYEESR